MSEMKHLTRGFMKNHVSLILAGLALAAAGIARAAAVGSPETQGQGKIAVAAEYSYIFRRDLDFQSASRPPHHENDSPENFRIDGGNNILGKVTCGVFDFLDLYVKLGVADYDLKGDVYVGDTRAVTEKLSARAAFLYGGGMKLAYEIKDGWIIGLDAEYLTSDHTLDFTATSASGAVTKATYGTCWMQEWHAAPYVARKISSFTPYAGARYSDFRMNQEDPDDPKRWDNLRFRAEYNIGVFAGTDWNLGKHFKLNIEGRFIDETAISASAAYRF